MDTLLQALGDALERRRARQLDHLRRIFTPMRVLSPLLGYAVSAWLLWWIWPEFFTGQRISDALFLVGICLYMPLVFMLFTPGEVGSGFGSGLIPDGSRPFAASARAFALALLEAARRREATIAPAAEDAGAMEQLASASSTAQDEVVAPLEHPLAASTHGRAFYIFIIWFAVALVAIMVAVLGGEVWMATQFEVLGQPALILIGVCSAMMSSLAVFILIAGVLSARVARQARLGLAAIVDNEGVTFRLAGVEGQSLARITWGDTQAIGRISYRDGKLVQRTVYLLVTARDVALWAESKPPRYSSEPVIERARVRSNAARRLLVLFQARTGLPLLDLTTTVDALAAKYDDPRLSLAWNLPTQALDAARTERDEALATEMWRLLHPNGDGESQLNAWLRRRYARDRTISTLGHARRAHLLDITRAMAPYLPSARVDDPLFSVARRSPARRQLDHMRMRLLTAQVKVVLSIWGLIVALLLAGWLARPLYSVPAENALATQAPRMEPRYLAPLDTATGSWPVGTLHTSQFVRFTNQGYEIVTGDADLTAVATAQSVRIDDGALMVTMSLSGSPGAYPTGGLALLSASGTGGLIFETDERGRWDLFRYRASCPAQAWECDGFLDSGTTTAYRTTAGESLTLLLIRRGHTCLLYLNGRFLDAYHDAITNRTSDDRVGLVADGAGITARFTNLAVYPVPAGMPFWAW